MPQNDPGGWRFSGAYGSAWDASGNLISDLVSVAAPVSLGRTDVPLVGSLRIGHKQGRETREGTLRVQKIDTKWELQMYALLSQSLTQRRAARDGTGPAFNPEFGIVLKYDDPDALGVERWQLAGCRIWALTLGFDLNDELVEREYPLTWETETPLTAFKAQLSGSTPSGQYVVGAP